MNLDAPAHPRLFAEFAAALEQGDATVKVDTPAFRIGRQSIGEVLVDELAGSDWHDTLQALLGVLAKAMKSTDTDTRLHAMAAAAALARKHADYHAAAGNQQDIDDDQEFRANYSLPGFEGIAR